MYKSFPFFSYLFLRTHFDIPFKYKGILSFSISLMSYLLTVIAAISLFVGKTTNVWQKQLLGSITVQVAIDSSIPAYIKNKKLLIIEKKLSIVPGVIHVSRCKTDIRTLLQPWLGKKFSFDGLPVPVLFNLTTNRAIRISSIESLIKPYTEYYLIKDHTFWVQRARFLQMIIVGFGVFFCLLLISVFILMIISGVKHNLILYQNTIRILHNVGATDEYIMNQFIAYIMRVVWFSSMYGFFSGLMTFLIILSILFFFGMGFLFVEIIWLLIIPVVFTFSGGLSAYFCVKNTLHSYV